MLPYASQSKYIASPNYQTVDTDCDWRGSSILAYQTIKTRQMMSSILDTIDQKANDPNDLKRSLSTFDKQFLHMYTQTNTKQQSSTQNTPYTKRSNPKYHNNFFNTPQIPTKVQSFTPNNQAIKSYQRLPQKSSLKLKLPKPNTLTDQFMKTMLGAEEELIEEYDRRVHPGKYQQKVNEQMRKNAKKLFSQHTGKEGNVVREVEAIRGMGRSEAFFDEQYYTYLKTNMKYLSEMGVNSIVQKPGIQGRILIGNFQDKIKNQFPLNSQHVPNISGPQFIHVEHCPIPHPDTIVRKLQETGGIENTIQRMERSLKKNEIKHMKDNQYIKKTGMELLDKRLSLDRSHEGLGNQYGVKLSIYGSGCEGASNKISITCSGVRENVLRLKERETAYNKKQYPDKMANPSKFKQPPKQQIRPKDWRQKSQSLRHKISHSIERR